VNINHCFFKWIKGEISWEQHAKDLLSKHVAVAGPTSDGQSLRAPHTGSAAGIHWAMMPNGSHLFSAVRLERRISQCSLDDSIFFLLTPASAFM
jgi:hypothetical protein